jgi:hypothetical protein
MMLSARARTCAGTVMPRSLAALALTNELSLLRVLDRQVCRMRAFEDLADVACHALKVVSDIGAERRQAARLVWRANG